MKSYLKRRDLVLQLLYDVIVMLLDSHVLLHRILHHEQRLVRFVQTRLFEMQLFVKFVDQFGQFG